jgi:hypothetical protein
LEPDQFEEFMPQSIRVFWKPFNGLETLNFNWPPIQSNSTVLITASEYEPNAVASEDGSARRFVGSASISVLNIAPHGPPSDPNHGVTFRVFVDWGSPLNICTDIVVLDETPDVYYVPGANLPTLGEISE